MVALSGLLGLVLSSAALAEEEFLLDEPGIRVDLPKPWQPTPGSWSSSTIDAAYPDGSMQFFAWTDPFQDAPRDKTLDDWKERLVKKARARGMQEVSVEEASVAKDGSASFDLRVEAEGRKGWMLASVHEAHGNVLSFMVMAGDRKRRAAEGARDELASRLDVRTPPGETRFGAAISEQLGGSWNLPADWRPLIDAERTAAGAVLKKVGLPAGKDCWVAIRPNNPGTPDLMAACAVPLFLGIVDEYSIGGVDTVVRETLFAGAPMEPASVVPTGDRLGLRYAATFGERTVDLAIVPTADGVTQLWEVTTGEDHGAALDSVLAAAAYTAPHPVSPGETVAYYTSYRRSSPLVWGPALLVLGLVGAGGAGVMAQSRRRREALLDDDEI